MNSHKEMLQYVGIGENSTTDINLSVYPNPVKQSTTISFTLNEDAQTTVDIFNLQGQKVATPANEFLAAGQHQLTWAPNANISNGIYLMKMHIGGKLFSQKLAIQR